MRFTSRSFFGPEKPQGTILLTLFHHFFPCIYIHMHTPRWVSTQLNPVAKTHPVPRVASMVGEQKTEQGVKKMIVFDCRHFTFNSTLDTACLRLKTQLYPKKSRSQYRHSSQLALLISQYHRSFFLQALNSHLHRLTEINVRIIMYYSHHQQRQQSI